MIQLDETDFEFDPPAIQIDDRVFKFENDMIQLDETVFALENPVIKAGLRTRSRGPWPNRTVRGGVVDF